MQVKINDNPAYVDNIELYFFGDGDYGKRVGLQMRGDFQLVEVRPGEKADPTLRLSRETAQALFTALSELGFTPKDHGELVGEIKAQTKHLADMRRIVFAKKDRRGR